ncbi:MAG: C_GCAxxG_C_C family protein [Magnetococcales bacterium]|nr:C_GCAxxG_C_C family protein [Magnetococcales bacterium]
MVRGVAELFARQGSDPAELARLGSGLCGGMGGKKATCGVFSGGALALGLLYGRERPEETNRQARQMAGRFFEILSEQTGGHVCEKLLAKFGPSNRLTHARCHRLARNGAILLANMILETEHAGHALHPLAAHKDDLPAGEGGSGASLKG